MLVPLLFKSAVKKNVLDLMCLTVLVYDYNEVFKIDSMSKITKDDCGDPYLCQNVLDKFTDYRKDAMIRLYENSPHGEVTKFIDDPTSDIQVGVTISKTNKRITVAFRGSESFYDWWHDFQILKYNLRDNVYVHTGFYKQ